MPCLLRMKIRSRGDEIKYCTLKYSHKGGFYWAGAYASGDYLVFGSDDGSAEGNYTNTSILYSVSTSTGVMLDKLTGLKGDIRTSVAYNNGYVYFATKGGYLYRVKMNQDGTFGQVLGYNLGGMATATPVIYKGGSISGSADRAVSLTRMADITLM